MTWLYVLFGIATGALLAWLWWYIEKNGDTK